LRECVISIRSAGAGPTENLLSEGADRVAAFCTVQAEPAVAELGELFTADPLTGKDARQDKVKYRRFMIHTAGGNA